MDERGETKRLKVDVQAAVREVLAAAAEERERRQAERDQRPPKTAVANDFGSQ